VNRRDFLAAALFAPLARQRDSRSLGTLPLGSPGGRTPPFGQLLGNGLDARLFTDFSGLSAEKPDALVTPNDRFYVRTAAPDHLPPSLSGIGTSFGGAGRPDRATSVPAGGTEVSGIDFARLERAPGRVRVGPYLMECAGNSDPTNFGLMSVAAWAGFSMPAIIEQLGAERSGQRVLISGTDPTGRSLTSVPGASWIFSRDQLERAVLAVEMNDAPLPVDHGGSARLLVPGWYGCACVKWVNRIELVPDEAPATTQMQEFAARTHQPFDSAALAASLRPGAPLLAREFKPAVIDTAAMPVRVEKWLVGGRLEYRITGIIWGGSTPTNALSIRFKSGGTWTRVENCPLPQSTLTWSLWTHTWRPEAPGRYQIVLRVDDPAIRTRRLEIFFYVREVQIDEV
jgi:DMSO/TMAO reductase YedYZ molybdopterin-dependent catalytic subunit